MRPASRSPRSTSPVRRACAAATPTTTGCAKCSAGSRRSRSKTASPAPTRGSKRRSPSSWTRRSPMLWRKSEALEVKRVDVLGVKVSAVSMDDTLDVLDCWITEDARTYVCVTGVHGVMESRRDARLRDIHHDAGLVTPDGMPLVWWSRAAGCRNVTRVYGPDLMLAACRRSLTTGYRHFFYGGNDGVADLLANRLSQ